jgi:RNA polymerase sigma-70 factor, ECF subfamily
VKNENQLLELAKQYDLNALAEIYDLYSPGLYRYAVRLLNNQDLAEDCVAETFSRFLNALRNQGGPKTYLKAYLYRIAHNWITDLYRREPIIQSDDYIDSKANPSSTTADVVDDILEREKVRTAIKLLTPDQRQVVVLKFLEGWSNAEVAESIKKPVGSVKSLQHRALGSLQRILSEDNK